MRPSHSLRLSVLGHILQEPYAIPAGYGRGIRRVKDVFWKNELSLALPALKRLGEVTSPTPEML